MDWDSNCSKDLNLTIDYSHLYHGDRTKLTVEYDGNSTTVNQTLVYFVCLRRYIPELSRYFFYTKLACIETDDGGVSIPWQWRFHGNATVLANVYSFDNFFDIDPLACAKRNITVGSKL